MELEEVKNQLMEWLDKCKYACYKEEDCIFIDGDYVFLRLYTDGHVYAINARPPSQRDKNDKSYLGCVASSRKSRAGEDWTRGSDLADGTFCRETWIKILEDIVGYELVKIQRPVKELHKERKQREAERQILLKKAGIVENPQKPDCKSADETIDPLVEES